MVLRLFGVYGWKLLYIVLKEVTFPPLELPGSWGPLSVKQINAGGVQSLVVLLYGFLHIRLTALVEIHGCATKR